MTTTTGFTVEHFLFGENVDATTALAQRLHDPEVTSAMGSGLKLLSGSGRAVLAESLAGVARRLVDTDLGDVLMAGWRSHATLVQAARATVADPALDQVVDLTTHRLTYAQQPTVDILFDAKPVARLTFGLELVWQVAGLAAVVRAGRLVAFRSGRGELAATLTVQSVALAQKRAEVDPHLVIRLGDGIPLLGSAVR